MDRPLCDHIPWWNLRKATTGAAIGLVVVVASAMATTVAVMIACVATVIVTVKAVA